MRWKWLAGHLASTCAAAVARRVARSSASAVDIFMGGVIDYIPDIPHIKQNIRVRSVLLHGFQEHLSHFLVGHFRHFAFLEDGGGHCAA